VTTATQLHPEIIIRGVDTWLIHSVIRSFTLYYQKNTELKTMTYLTMQNANNRQLIAVFEKAFC